ncbi:amidase domain-containing protein [Bacillus sp. 2205SS5-2]|uniref:amidase domain-containing protein n=1 Tax=Bacillus sp. 2205SS5-2 TaxID=3109031 RepID=UPI0030062C91
MREIILKEIEKRITETVKSNGDFQEERLKRKQKVLQQREAEIVKVNVSGNIDQIVKRNQEEIINYHLHFQYLIKQKKLLYLEEEVERRYSVFENGELMKDEGLMEEGDKSSEPRLMVEENHDERLSYRYDRLKAVKYAERWWNSYNSAYKKFEVDCTNFISQCLHAGGAPMRGQSNRSKGWWMSGNNWSYSWSVANSLRWYLPSSKVGLRGTEVRGAEELKLGDVICYDFEGDGRYNHNTIVTAKDAYGFPLVNAHTHNSRMRYWNYEDSTAYTPNIKYKFFSIVDDA